MAQVKTYVRPMQGWWRRNPYFVRYMYREASSVFVAIYALTLLVGLVRLNEGRAEYEAWRAALASPLAVAFHVVAFLFVSYHAYTWWLVAPKTAPNLPIPDQAISAGGWLATVAASIAVYCAARWL